MKFSLMSTVALCGLLLIGAGCDSLAPEGKESNFAERANMEQQQMEGGGSIEGTNKGEESQEQMEGFDVSTLEPGDTVGAWKVVSVEPANPDYAEMSDRNVLIVFSGNVTVEGTYTYVEDGMIAGPRFSPSEKSQERLPSVAGESRGPFYFTNFEETVEMIGREERDAAIVINEYVLINLPAGVVDRATFDSLAK